MDYEVSVPMGADYITFYINFTHIKTMTDTVILLRSLVSHYVVGLLMYVFIILVGNHLPTRRIEL